jgi:tryptophan-rich sensory protein
VPANTDPQPAGRPAGPQARNLPTQVLGLLAFVALSVTAWALATVPILLNMHGWFAASVQAPWMPPQWMFRSVWLLLYGSIAVAAWLVWRKGALTGGTMAGYLLQLLLNAAWPLSYFGLYPLLGPAALWAALVVLTGLAGCLVFLILRFGPVNGLAGLLVLPYFSWVLFSCSLNLYAALHN